MMQEKKMKIQLHNMSKDFGLPFVGKVAIVAALLIMPARAVKAQVASDSVSADVSGVGNQKEVSNDGIFRGNIKDIYLQTRYRPQENDTLFYQLPFWRRFYFGAGGGIHNAYDDVTTKISGGVAAYIGYSFSPIHSLRAQFTSIFYHPVSLGSTYSKIGMEADYVANLTTFAFGYNPIRKFDVSSVVGGGVQFTHGALQSRALPFGKFGIHMNFHVTSNYSFFLEPYVGVQQSMPQLFGRDNPSSWNAMYGINGGIDANLLNRYKGVTTDSTFRRAFFDSSFGWTFVPGTGSGFHTSGTAYQAALGTWFNPIVGVRLGLSAQEYIYNTTPNSVPNNGMRFSAERFLLSARAEMLLDPLNISRKWREKQGGHDFDLNVLLGGEYGYMMKGQNEYYRTIGHDGAYWGATGALQFMYRINNPGTFIFFEPRYMGAFFNDSKANGDREDPEHTFSMAIGTRIYLKHYKPTTVEGSVFKPHWWAAFDIGGVKWTRSENVKNGGIGINPSFSIALGYDLAKFASFRAQMNYQHMNLITQGSFSGYNGQGQRVSGSAFIQNRYNVLDFRLLYMLNVNTLFQGYNAERKYSLWYSLGPALTYLASNGVSEVGNENGVDRISGLGQLTTSTDKTGKISPAVYTSLMAALRVAPAVEVTAEVGGQYNFLVGTDPGTHATLNNIKYYATVGTRYHFITGSKVFRGINDKQYYNPNLFYESSLGVNIASFSDDFLNRMGVAYEMAFGKWFNSVLGGRVGVSGKNDYWSVDKAEETGKAADLRRDQSIFNMRFEALVNPLNLSRTWREKEGGHDFEFNFSAGLDLGVNTKSVGSINNKSYRNNFMYGFTASTQFMYRINNPGTYIYLEPRVQTLGNHQGSNVTGSLFSSNETNMSISVGSRIYYDRKKDRLPSPEEFRPHWWAGISLGGAKRTPGFSATPQSVWSLGISPELDFNVGYDYKPLASFRMMLAYEHMYHRNANTMVETNYNEVDLRLAYMLNINNAMQGYRSDRRFNLYWTVGPAVSFVMPVNGGTTKASPAINTSLMATMKVARNVDIDVEALGQCDIMQITPAWDSRFNRVKYAVTIGTRYHFDQDQIKGAFEDLQRHPWEKGWGLEFAAGWNVPLGTPNGGGHASGTNLTITADHMFNALLGMRVGINGRYGYWANTSRAAVIGADGQQIHSAYDQYLGEYQIGARAELLVNPLSLMTKRKQMKEAPKWDMNLSVGMDLGFAHKAHNASGTARVRCLTGFTTAAQVLYRLNDVSQLYVEPRYSLTNGGIPDGYLGASDKDNFFTISVGTRISRPTPKKNEKVTPDMLSHRGWWAQFEAGIIKHTQDIRTVIGSSTFQPGIALSGAYDFTRLHTARVRFDWYRNGRDVTDQRFTSVASDGVRYSHTGTVTTDQSLIDLQFMYMLNITNLWTGLDRQNKFTVYWEAGTGLAACVGNSVKLASGEKTFGSDVQIPGQNYTGKVSPIMLTGIMMAMKVYKGLDVTTEVIGQYDFNHTKLMLQQCPRYINGIKLDCNVGLRYRF